MTVGLTAAPGLDTLAGLVSHTTVQGIPTLYAPRQGETTAGLFFRVGRADETLATSGITHLVEHLALHRLGLTDAHHNGTTANAYTLFHVTGSEAEVVAHLNGVCAALRDLPMERLETEREILRTEASGRGSVSQLPMWRHGARGYGLSSYNEMGTWSLTAEQVRDWAATRFTRENAVLWITSDHVPEGLDLSLPAGTRFPAPAATDALPVTPAFVPGDDGHVLLTSVVRRSTAASLFADVLGRALFHDLRQEGGYSYSAEADYSPRDADHAVLTAYADALPKKQDAVVGGFVDTLARLRAGRITQTELDSARARALKVFDVPDLGAAALPSYAVSVLLGHRVLGPEQQRAELAAVTVGDLHEVAHEVWDAALFQVPGRGLDWAGCTLAPQHSEESVTGTRHPSLTNDAVTLVVGAEGVSLEGPRGPVTVRYDAVSAMTTRPDGARSLTGHDGFNVTVEPNLFRGVTPAKIAEIDAAVPPEAVVALPAREPGQIPAAPAPPTTKQKWRKLTAADRKRLLTAVLLTVPGLLMLVPVLRITFGELQYDTPDTGRIVVVWIPVTLLLVLAYRAVAAFRSARRR
ncbi:insulinase family protein [Streptomyces sp. NPDC008150]|uniref:M16 family metallopeptidase n=1 Tax=Streptomyces sp. NPDC008150 TaxID=3364816 RepID=UPI0036E8E8E5